MGKPKKSGLPPYTAREEHRGVFHRPYLGRKDGKIKWGTRVWLADLAAPLDEIWSSYRELVVNKEELEETMEEVTEVTNDLKPTSEIFAENLKAYMTQNDISTNGVAMRTGISQKTLWVTINKKNVPTLDTAKSICDALDVDMRIMISRLLTSAELNRTKAVGRAADGLIGLPTERVKAVREIADAFAK